MIKDGQCEYALVDFTNRRIATHAFPLGCFVRVVPAFDQSFVVITATFALKTEFTKTIVFRASDGRLVFEKPNWEHIFGTSDLCFSINGHRLQITRRRDNKIVYERQEFTRTACSVSNDGRTAIFSDMTSEIVDVVYVG